MRTSILISPMFLACLLTLAACPVAAQADTAAMSYPGPWAGAAGDGPNCDGPLTGEWQAQMCLNASAASVGATPFNNPTWGSEGIPCVLPSTTLLECSEATFKFTQTNTFLDVAYMYCPNGGGPQQGSLKFPGWCLVPGSLIPPTCPAGQQMNAVTQQCESPAELAAGDCPTCQKVGNPIDAGTGNKYEAITDYRGGGPFPLVFTRSYNSLIAGVGTSPDGADQGLGAGWSSNIGAHVFARQSWILTTASDGGHTYVVPASSTPTVEASVWHADGGLTPFYYNGNGGPDGTALVAESSTKGALYFTSTGFKYVRTDGYAELYDSIGRLTALQDPHGLQQTYAYTYATVGTVQVLQSIKVTDPTGRYLQVNYDTNITDANYGLLVTLNTPTGNIFYGYDSNHNLTSVTYQDGSVVTYEYNDTASGMSHALTGLKDEDGDEYAAWSYDDTSGKAICSEHAPTGNVASTATTCLDDTGGVDKTLVSYNGDGSADVTEPTGLVRHMTFTNVNGRYLLASVDKRCPTCGDTSHLISYDANGHVQQITDFDGNVTDYSIDAAGLEQSRTEAAGTASQRTIVTTWYTPSGGAELGLPESITEYAGDAITGTRMRVTTWCHNSVSGSCNDSSATGPGAVWTMTVSDPVNTSLAARTTTYTYTGGLLTKVDGPLTGLTDATNLTYYTSSSAGFYNIDDLQKVTDALGHVTTVTQYSASGRPMSVTDMNSVVTTLSYDARDRLLGRTLDSGGTAPATTSYTYNPDGTLHTLVSPITASGHAYETYSYDRAHRLTNVLNDVGDSRSYTYTYDTTTATYDVAEQRFASGNNTAVYTHHLTRVDAWDTVNGNYGQSLDTDGQGHTTTSQLDPNGNVAIVTDALGHTTHRYFDALDRLQSVQDPKGNTTTYNVDALDHVDDVTSPRGLDTGYVYDAFGELLSQASPDSGTTTYDYTGWVSSATITSRDARSKTQTYTYDALQRLLSDNNGQSSFTFTYDDTTAGNNSIGRLRTATDIAGTNTYFYDSHGNVRRKSVNNGNLFIVTYVHDLADGVIQMTYPPASGTINYTRDALDRVTEVDATYSGGPNERLAYNVGYEPFGPLMSLNYGNGLVETRGFDTAYRLTGIHTKNGTTPAIQDWSYAYNADDTVSGITDNLTSANNQTFSYDPMQRLVTATGVYGSISIGADPVNHPELSYDADGNRTQKTQGGVTTTYSYDSASNRLLSYVTGSATTTYAYDADGSVTSDGTYTYNYNINERNTKVLQGATTLIQNEYNSLGERATKTTVNGMYNFIYDEQGHVLAELNPNGTIYEQHIWIGDRPIAYYARNINGSTAADVKYLHVDQLGTPRIMTTSTKAIGWSWNPDPWGNPGIGLSGFGPRMPGQYYDGLTGDYQNWNRDYNAVTGRYLQSDPIGLGGGINTYTYVDNDPIEYLDMDGTSKTQGQASISGSDPIVAGVNKNSTPEEINQAIKNAQEALKNPDISAARKDFLRGWIKVAKRGFTRAECGPFLYDLTNRTMEMACALGDAQACRALMLVDPDNQIFAPHED